MEPGEALFYARASTETFDDIEGIAELSNKIAALFYTIPKDRRPGGGRVEIVTSTSFFVPKPFTPFQWVRQNNSEEFLEKQRFLNGKIKEQLNKKSIKYNWHDVELTQLEGILARGDRRLGAVLLDAYHNGCLYDSWSESFKYDMWMKALRTIRSILIFIRQESAVPMNCCRGILSMPVCPNSF